MIFAFVNCAQMHLRDLAKPAQAIKFCQTGIAWIVNKKEPLTRSYLALHAIMGQSYLALRQWKAASQAYLTMVAQFRGN